MKGTLHHDNLTLAHCACVFLLNSHPGEVVLSGPGNMVSNKANKSMIFGIVQYWKFPTWHILYVWHGLITSITLIINETPVLKYAHIMNLYVSIEWTFSLQKNGQTVINKWNDKLFSLSPRPPQYNKTSHSSGRQIRIHCTIPGWRNWHFTLVYY